MARPTKLTPALEQAICDAIRQGAWFTEACRSVGVSKTTGYEWRRRGCGEDPRPITSRYSKFALAVDLAFATWHSQTRVPICGPSVKEREGAEPGVCGPPNATTFDH